MGIQVIFKSSLSYILANRIADIVLESNLDPDCHAINRIYVNRNMYGEISAPEDWEINSKLEFKRCGIKDTDSFFSLLKAQVKLINARYNPESIVVGELIIHDQDTSYEIKLKMYSVDDIWVHFAKPDDTIKKIFIEFLKSKTCIDKPFDFIRMACGKIKIINNTAKMVIRPFDEFNLKELQLPEALINELKICGITDGNEFMRNIKNIYEYDKINNDVSDNLYSYDTHTHEFSRENI